MCVFAMSFVSPINGAKQKGRNRDKEPLLFIFSLLFSIRQRRQRLWRRQKSRVRRGAEEESQRVPPKKPNPTPNRSRRLSRMNGEGGTADECSLRHRRIRRQDGDDRYVLMDYHDNHLSCQKVGHAMAQ